MIEQIVKNNRISIVEGNMINMRGNIGRLRVLAIKDDTTGEIEVILNFENCPTNFNLTVYEFETLLSRALTISDDEIIPGPFFGLEKISGMDKIKLSIKIPQRQGDDKIYKFETSSKELQSIKEVFYSQDKFNLKEVSYNQVYSLMDNGVFIINYSTGGFVRFSKYELKLFENIENLPHNTETLFEELCTGRDMSTTIDFADSKQMSRFIGCENNKTNLFSPKGKEKKYTKIDKCLVSRSLGDIEILASTDIIQRITYGNEELSLRFDCSMLIPAEFFNSINPNNI